MWGWGNGEKYAEGWQGLKAGREVGGGEGGKQEGMMGRGGWQWGGGDREGESGRGGGDGEGSSRDGKRVAMGRGTT